MVEAGSNIDSLPKIKCKVAAKSIDNPFETGKLYPYSEDQELVFTEDYISYALGTFDSESDKLTVYKDYFDQKSPTLAVFTKEV